jgi:DnaK suppressor protein
MSPDTGIDMAEIENIKILEKEKERLSREMERLQQSEPSTDSRREGSPFGKREEEADEAMELEKRLAMKKHLTNTLTEIDRALDKFKAGTYGICDCCGNPIEPARMEALPHANLCLNCKSRQSRELKSRLAR